MYRGADSLFDGYYFYGDYCSAFIWLAVDGVAGWTSTVWPLAAATLSRISSFGEDGQGNLDVTERDAGKVFRIVTHDLVFSSSFE